jgi:hypothetical protein
LTFAELKTKQEVERMNRLLIATIAMVSVVSATAIASSDYTCGNWGFCSGTQYRTCYNQMNPFDSYQEVQSCTPISDGAVLPDDSKCELNSYVSKYCTKANWDDSKCPMIRSRLFVICKSSATFGDIRNLVTRNVGWDYPTIGWNYRLGKYWFAWVKR